MGGKQKIQTFLFLEGQPIVQLQLNQSHMDQQLLGELQIHLQVLIGQIWLLRQNLLAQQLIVILTLQYLKR